MLPELVKPQSANVRSFELSKETLKPQAFLSGLDADGSEVFQLKPAWLPSGVLSETVHEPAGRSEAFWASFSTAPDLSRMPPVNVAAVASGAKSLGAKMLSEPNASVMADSAAAPLRAFRHETLFLEEFIPRSFLKNLNAPTCSVRVSTDQVATKAENTLNLDSLNDSQPKSARIV